MREPKDRKIPQFLIIGAGAVGRGFVAPLLGQTDAEIDFADTDQKVLDTLDKRSEYLTAVIGPDGYSFRSVSYRDVFHPDNITAIAQYDAVFICTGVRNYLACAQTVSDARTVYVLENARDASDRLRAASGNPHVWFGIPDVIVSDSAPEELRQQDPLCVTAEQGELILEGEEADFGAMRNVVVADAKTIEKYWACKFFVHNASHAVLGFLGALAGHEFVHQAMADKTIGPLVETAIRTITDAVIASYLADEDFARAYMERELRRFKNSLLHDPIERVAKDPLRKLSADDRLIQALELVRNAGFDPHPILLGINAALKYSASGHIGLNEEQADPSQPEQILRTISGLRDAPLIHDILAVSADEFLA